MTTATKCLHPECQNAVTDSVICNECFLYVALRNTASDTDAFCPCRRKESK